MALWIIIFKFPASHWIKSFTITATINKLTSSLMSSSLIISPSSDALRRMSKRAGLSPNEKYFDLYNNVWTKEIIYYLSWTWLIKMFFVIHDVVLRFLWCTLITIFLHFHFKPFTAITNYLLTSSSIRFKSNNHFTWNVTASVNERAAAT